MIEIRRWTTRWNPFEIDGYVREWFSNNLGMKVLIQLKVRPIRFLNGLHLQWFTFASGSRTILHQLPLQVNFCTRLKNLFAFPLNEMVEMMEMGMTGGDLKSAQYSPWFLVRWSRPILPPGSFWSTSTLPSPPKGRLAPNLLHCPPTCCSALWTSCLTDTHITTPSRRYSENIHTSCKSRGKAIIWAGQGPEIGEDMVARCGWDLLAGHLDVWLGQKHASIWPHTAPESLPHPI